MPVEAVFLEEFKVSIEMCAEQDFVPLEPTGVINVLLTLLLFFKVLLFFASSLLGFFEDLEEVTACQLNESAIFCFLKDHVEFKEVAYDSVAE